MTYEMDEDELMDRQDRDCEERDRQDEAEQLYRLGE